MARTSGQSTDTPAGSFTHRPSGTRFVVEAGAVRSGGLVRGLPFFVGSGTAGRSFLTGHDGFLFLAPVTWYAQQRRWDVSPGYQQARDHLWTRPIEPNCLFCHSTRPQPIFGTQNRYADPPFLEGGIGCERCHGPGSAHVGGGPIVNPAKLAGPARSSICAQCHLAGKARINRPGKELAMYRPGERFSDYVSVFVASARGGRLRVTSHVEKLSQSACRDAASGPIECGACHQVHGDSAERASLVQRTCLECHSARLDPAHAARPSCAACHMPRVKASDANHGVFTDHSIPRVARPQVEEPRAPVLVPSEGFTSDDRMLGLAYAEVALESGEPFHRREALRLLRRALPEAAGDWNLLTRLAFLEEPDAALALYERSLAVRPRQPVALVNAGALHAARGNLPRAMEYWLRALSMNPGLSEASRNLATALRAAGRGDEAQRVLREAARFDPEVGR
jgi:hypothetical protein